MLSSTLMHWDFALILIFLGLAVPWLGRRRIRQLLALPQTTKMDRLALYASTIAFQWLAAAVILWRTASHGIPAARLGLAIPQPRLTYEVSIALAALILANQISSLRRLVARPAEIQGIVPQLALKIFPQDNLERLIFFALAATVAVCEELIYRGFVQLVFESLSGGVVAAGIVGSAAMFGLAHLYQGRKGLFTTSFLGLLFSIIRAWTGSLLAPLVAHFVADFTIGLMAPSRLRTAMASHASAGTRGLS
jgi:membrane protease YdiL (CAAX protease family)